ncbi:trypsin-like serine protease [Kiritimatiellaeota bacterium B1221]|nr:trypsin-like serine protease [Kiritimatiellaeota bacterium B1221]
MKFTFIWFLFLFGGFIPLKAVFVGTNDPNSNTSAPVDDQGWSYMGVYNTGGAVYLGNGWFITAGHLGTGAGTVNYDGSSYAIDGSSWVTLQNPDTSNVDSRLFQITTPGDLATTGAQIVDSALSLGDDLTMIGYGRDVSSVSTTGPWTKYYESTTSNKKWGENTVDSFVSDYSGAGYTSDTFQTVLTTGTAQALDKDSGGGVFVYDAATDSYQLAGIMIAATRYSDEGGIYASKWNGVAANSSWTRSVDLYQYRDQIVSVIPEPAPWILAGGALGLLFLVTRIRRS